MIPVSTVDQLTPPKRPIATGFAPDFLVLIICIAPLIAAFFAIFSYFGIGDTSLFDKNTMMYSTQSIVVSILIALISVRMRLDFLTIMIFLGNIFVFPRIVQFLLAPHIVFFPFPLPLSIVEINTGILAYTATLIAISAGSIVAAFILRNSAKIEHDAPPFAGNSKYYIAIAVFFVFVALEFFVQNSSEMFKYKGSFERSESISTFTKLLVVLASSDTVLFLVVFLGFSSGRPIPLRRILAIAALSLVFIALYATLGSRGAGMRVMMILIACALCVNFRSLRYSAQVVSVAAFAVLATIAVYPLAEGFRQGESWETAGTMYVKPPQTAGAAGAAGVAIVSNHLTNVLNRLANFDYVAVTAAREPAQECAAKYLTLDYAAKNVVNQIAVGDPFPEARMSTSNAFRLCYGERSEADLTYYHSEIWTLLGLAKAYFGGFALLGCVVVGFFIQFIGNMLRGASQSWIRASYAFYLLLIPSAVMYSMGLDHTINTIIISFIRLMVAIAAVEVVSWLFAKAALWQPFRKAREQ